RVLTQTPALHLQRDHVDRRSHGNPIVHRGEQKRLRAATRLARCPDRIATDIRKRLQEVHRADAVPQLQTGEAEAPQVLPLSTKRVRKLLAVAVANHVVAEDDEPLTSEADGARGS